MRAAHGITAALCLPILLALPQEPTPAGAEGRPARTPKFFLDAGQHTVEDLVTRSGEYLGRTYLINTAEDPGAQTTSIELDRRLEFDAAGCEEVVSQLLYTKMWVCTPLDAGRKIYEWVFLPGPRRTEIKRRVTFVPWEEIGARPGLFSYVSTVYPLKHIDASRAVNTMRAMLQMDSAGLELMTPIGTSVLLQGFRGTVATVLQMLEQADQPGPRIEPPVDDRLKTIERRLGALEQALEKK